MSSYPLITVKARALGFYTASTDVFLSFQSPYRSSAMNSMRIVFGWGRSAEAATQRCKRRAERIQKLDAEWAKADRERTTVVCADP